MSTAQTPESLHLAFLMIMAGMSFLMALGSFAATVVLAVRVVTKTEVGLENITKQSVETATLARKTADEFNGPARNAHTELTARVAAVEKDVAQKASTQQVVALGDRVEQQMKHLESIFRSEFRRFAEKIDADGSDSNHEKG